MFSNINSCYQGVVLKSGIIGNKYDIGYYSGSWGIDGFRKFEDSITLKNV